MRLAVWTLLALAVVGCGHPATVKECEEIVERVAKLELEEYLGSNSGVVDREIAKTKQALRESTMKDCVGKRITDDALTCVRQAQSASEVVEECFH